MSLILWCLHLQLRPFRFFESGLPQPADYVAVLLWLLLILGRKPALPSPIVNYYRCFGYFVAYVVLVNSTWWTLNGDPEFLIASIYYLYNFLGCTAFLKLYGLYGKSFLQLTAGCVTLALIVQFIAATGIATDYGGREALFFVNPNQLAYYVVLSLSVLWACWTSRGPNGATVPVVVEVAGFACAGYLVLMSQSRAGFAAVCVALLGRFLNGKQFLVGVTVVALVAICLQFNSPLLTALHERTEAKHVETSEELGIRGYDRILNHKEYLLLGSGEGVHERFESEHDGELHSSIGTILFSYGVVGVVLAYRMIRSIVLGAGFSSLVYLTPLLIYSVAHNGLRQLEMWWLMPLIICLCTSNAGDRRNNRAMKRVGANVARSRALLPADYRRKSAQAPLA